MSQEVQTQLLLMLPVLLALLGLFLSVIIDPHLRRDQRWGLIIMVMLVIVLMIADYVEFLYRGDTSRTFELTLSRVGGFILYPLITMMFIIIVRNKERVLWVWILVIVNALVYMTAFFSDIAFSYDSKMELVSGPLFYTCHVICAVMLYWLLILTTRIFNREKPVETLIPIFSLFLIGAGTIADSVLTTHFAIRFLTIVIAIESVFYYIWLHLQFERSYEKALLAEHRIKIMISQIQPHFLFNTLSTIQALCRIDPEKAARTTEMFGQYLRLNIDSLDQSSLIPINSDIEHMKTYVEIEKLRFPSIEVIYDIREKDFMVPALTIQPMVENAIRHGVRGMEHGIIKVQTLAKGDDYLIIIQDNGKGFEMDKIYEDKKNHIGIRNVRERIELMCNGTLDVDSHIGEGTTITIRIPSRKDLS